MKTIGIIGGNGQMGKAFLEYFLNIQNRIGGGNCPHLSDSYDVIISDIGTEISNKKLAQKSDIVIIVVPIEQTEKIIEEVGPHLKKDSLFMDFTSVKKSPTNAMLKNFDGAVIGAHPMFGPRNVLPGQTMVLCPVRPRNFLPEIRDLFSIFKIVEIEPEEHDKAMAYIQGLQHFFETVFGKVLEQSGVSRDTFLQLASPAYKIHMAVMARVLGQSASLSSHIVHGSKYAEEAIQDFLRIADNLATEKDYETFEKIFEEARDFFGDYCEVAKEETDGIIGMLLEKNGEWRVENGEKLGNKSLEIGNREKHPERVEGIRRCESRACPDESEYLSEANNKNKIQGSEYVGANSIRPNGKKEHQNFLSEKSLREISRQVGTSSQSPPPNAIPPSKWGNNNSKFKACPRPRSGIQNLKIGILGPELTWSDLAAQKFFPKAEKKFSVNFSSIFRAIDVGDVEAGFVPVENKIFGSVREVWDEMSSGKFWIDAIYEFPIRHILCAPQPDRGGQLPPPIRLENITTVFGHEAALSQCSNFLREKLPNAKIIPVASTAEGVLRIQGKENSAAISTAEAAEKNGMNVMAREISNISENVTRFALVRKRETRNWKLETRNSEKKENLNAQYSMFNTSQENSEFKKFSSTPIGDQNSKLNVSSFFFELENKPGALFEFLKIFKEKNKNLVRLESKPTGRKFSEYAFYVDLEGDLEEDLEEILREETKSFLVLGRNYAIIRSN